MKKRIVTLLIAATMIFTLIPIVLVNVSALDTWDGTSSSEYQGSGTKASPYVIASAANLKYLADAVNSGNNYSGYYFTLTTDIDLNGKEWTPIGNSTNFFAGLFNGGGHTISGLSITADIPYTGLFGSVAPTYLYDTVISGVRVEGTISSGYNVGGIVGYASTLNDKKVIIDGCSANISFELKTSTPSDILYIGGIVGYASFTDISFCKNEGPIKIEWLTYTFKVGGIAGYAESSKITDCYNTGAIDAELKTEGFWVESGGILGAAGTGNNISYCYNTANITIKNARQGTPIGGIVGRFVEISNVVTDCYNTGNQHGETYAGENYVYCGGIYGYTAKAGNEVISCYSMGTQTHVGGKDARNGGIAGCLNSKEATSFVKDSLTTSELVCGYINGSNVAENNTPLAAEADILAKTTLIDAHIDAGSKFDISALASTAAVEAVTTVAITTKAPETTKAPSKDTTAQPQKDTTAATPSTTAAPAVDTTAAGKAEKKGCSGSSSIIAMQLLFAISAAACFVIIKKTK